MPTVSLDAATTVDYEVWGAPGHLPDLVLIHGTGGSATTNWAHLAEELTAPGRRVIVPNYSGSGATVDDGGPLELDRVVAQVAAAAGDAGAERYDVAGFSLGAVIAARLAVTDLERVRRLVLICGWTTSSDGRFGLQLGLWRRLAGLDPVALAEVLTLTGFSAGFLGRRPPQATAKLVADSVATLPPGIARQAELGERIDLSHTVPLITQPTLVVGADEDAMVPVIHSHELASRLHDSRYEELQSGHLVLFEQPLALTNLINDHLSG